MSTNPLSTLVEQASIKFGIIHAMQKRPRHGDYIFLIERAEPARESAPFMTISAYAYEFSTDMMNYKTAFEHGHYDLSEGMGRKDFQERIDR